MNQSWWKRTTDLRTAVIFLAPSLFLFFLFTFYPLFRAAYLSAHLTDPTGAPSLFVGWENYLYLLFSPEFWNSLRVTFLFLLYTVPTSLVIGLYLALLANENLRGIGAFRVLFSSTKVISGSISAIVWSFLFHPSVGLINHLLPFFGFPPVAWLLSPEWSLFSLSVVTVWVNIGFAFLILLGGLQNIDQSLYESAGIDGAGFFYRLRNITLPMLSPTLFFLSTVMVINAFQSFGQIDILTKGGPNDSTNVIGYAIYREAFEYYQFGTASAQSMVLFLLMLVITLIQFKISEKKVHYQ
ncbi:carbohydrate ABC transporter permease [Brevibacillus sp. NRS-1366]|uniref:carbohydrate ABC transporter permease n=1 Tax=Brevibacillus sp. NRS-1366 TaxID=3233899 RepID=UPI003D232B43